MSLSASELILNTDGSVYHLNLLPQDISDTIITVGDPERVKSITNYFSSVEISKQKREFLTETGLYNGKRITVISTGIGTDNIDIVLNELDALVNIDLNSRRINSDLKQLNIIRIGTSGAIQEDIEVGSFIISEMSIGFDSLLHYYTNEEFDADANEINLKLKNHLRLKQGLPDPYVIKCNSFLLQQFKDERFLKGITATNVGFYGPQGRTLRLALKDSELNNKIKSFDFNGKRITNLEMETSGIYALSKLLGHRAISLNAILANRANLSFSNKPEVIVDGLIRLALEKITE